MSEKIDVVMQRLVEYADSHRAWFRGEFDIDRVENKIVFDGLGTIGGHQMDSIGKICDEYRWTWIIHTIQPMPNTIVAEIFPLDR